MGTTLVTTNRVVSFTSRPGLLLGKCYQLLLKTHHFTTQYMHRACIKYVQLKMLFMENLLDAVLRYRTCVVDVVFSLLSYTHANIHKADNMPVG